MVLFFSFRSTAAAAKAEFNIFLVVSKWGVVDKFSNASPWINRANGSIINSNGPCGRETKQGPTDAEHGTALTDRRTDGRTEGTGEWTDCLSITFGKRYAQQL